MRWSYTLASDKNAVESEVLLESSPTSRRDASHWLVGDQPGSLCGSGFIKSEWLR